MTKILAFIMLMMSICSCALKSDLARNNFQNPLNQYRPMPSWHLNGSLTKEGIEKQIKEAKTLSGFGGVTVLLVSPRSQFNTGLPTPGMTTAYLSQDYFEWYNESSC
jgi:hypothetical protein